jgi:hypothetical protein
VGAAIGKGGSALVNMARTGESEAVGELAGVAGPCFVAGTAIATADGSQPIEALHVGDRVMTPNQPSVLAEVDSANLTKWRKISLRMPNPECPNDTIDLQLLRTIEWFDSLSLSEDGRIWLDIDEVGLHGWAEVAGVEACPPIQAGAGRVVTGTITHLNSFVMEVRLVGQKQVLEPTDRHRLFSVTRNDWIPTAQLKAGEELATKTGTATVEFVEAKLGTHRVYNIEVEAEHCYFVGASGVLAHNACNVTRKIPRDELKYKPSARGEAPIGSDGNPVELHHLDQDMGNASPRAEMTRTDHRGKGNFGKNHQNTGQKPSAVDRTESSSQHKEYWSKEFDSGAFNNLPEK